MGSRFAGTVASTLALAIASTALPVSATTSPVREDDLPELRKVAILGDRLGGFVLPISPSTTDISLIAEKAWTWQVDDTQRIELRGGVRIRLGAYAFTSDRAWVWLNRVPSADGEINQVAIYFEKAEEPTRRAGFGASGEDLLVTSSARGAVSLRVTERIDAPAPQSGALRRGQQRLSGYLRSLLKSVDEGSARLRYVPDVSKPETPEEPAPVPGQPAIPPREAKESLGPRTVELPATGDSLPIVRPEGQISFSAKDIVIDEATNAATISGNVMIEYAGDSAEGDLRLELRAERAVVFLREGFIRSFREGTRTLEAGNVLGVYLEGGVTATDGNYALRGSKVYYDFEHNKAIVVDAVLRTYARLSRTVTLYARATEMRQLSRNEFTADHATVSTSEFFLPHLSVGAERVTLTQPPDDADSGNRNPLRLTAEDITLRAGTVPFFYLPGYEGDIEPNPLREVEVGYRSHQGAEILTRWDLFQLINEQPPENVDADLTLGGYTKRGPAIGSRWNYREGRSSGGFDIFGLYDLGGTDKTASGRTVTKDDGLRGVVSGEYQTYLSPELLLQTQLNYISDETFITAWRRGDFTDRREYETSVYLKDQSDNTAATFLAKHNLNSFISNSYLLAGPGYQVDKLPEVGYRRYGDNIWDNLLWTQIWNASVMSIRPVDGTVESLGVRRGAFAGIPLGQPIDQLYFDAGYSDNYVTRVHTRHELSYPWAEDNWTIAPFVSGEGSGYLFQDFDRYAPQGEDMHYLLGGGVRASSRFVRIDDTAESWFLDIHRLRHIVEPNATLWAGWSNTELGDLPIYDQDIEGSSGGAAAQFGVRQQFQTQRGGPGAWESVTFLTLDTGVVFNDAGSEFQQSDAKDPWVMAQSALPAFYTWRPELSQWGSHLYGMGSWQLSDSLTIAGTATYLVDDRATITRDNSLLENLAKGSIGLEMRHTPDVSTYVEYRYLAPTDSELLQLGILYQVGKKYLIALSPQYDLQEGDFRRVQGSLSRSFPDFNLSLTAGYDLIDDQTTFGISLRIPSDGSASSSGWENAWQRTER
jgi:hypothetical protein